MSLAPLSWGIAPTGPQMMAIWQDDSNQNTFTLSVGGSLNIGSGILYVPNANAQVNLTNNGSTTAKLGAEVIAGMLQLSGSGSFLVDTGPTEAPGRNLYLVE